jgi:hypothetical protein
MADTIRPGMPLSHGHSTLVQTHTTPSLSPVTIFLPASMSHLGALTKNETMRPGSDRRNDQMVSQFLMMATTASPKGPVRIPRMTGQLPAQEVDHGAGCGGDELLDGVPVLDDQHCGGPRPRRSRWRSGPWR